MESREKPIEYTKSDHCVGEWLLDIIDLRERAVEGRSNLFPSVRNISSTPIWYKGMNTHVISRAKNWKNLRLPRKKNVSTVIIRSFFSDMFLVSAKLHESRRAGLVILKGWEVFLYFRIRTSSFARGKSRGNHFSLFFHVHWMLSAFPPWYKSLSFPSLLFLLFHLFISPSFSLSLPFFLLVTLVNLSFAGSWSPWKSREVTKRQD